MKSLLFGALKIIGYSCVATLFVNGYEAYIDGEKYTAIFGFGLGLFFLIEFIPLKPKEGQEAE